MLGGGAGRRRARQHSQDHVAAGDARLQRLGAGGLDRAEPMIENRAQYLDELAVAVGVRLQLGAHLGQRGRQIPVLERRAVTQGAGLLHQHRQVMPGIVNDPVALELTRMIGDDFIAQHHDNALSMRAHQNHSAGGARIDAVAIVVGHDQAGGAGPDRLSTNPSNGPRSCIRLARSSSNTSQIVRSLNSGCRVRLA